MYDLQIDGIKIATISAELAARLRLALDRPHARVTRFDISETQTISVPVTTPEHMALSASAVRTTIALSIETSTGLTFTADTVA